MPLGVLAAKHVELLKEINPRLQRVGVLWHPALELNQARFERLQRAVESLGVLLIPVRATTYRDLEKIFVSLGDGRPDGLLLMEQLIGTLRAEIAQFALEHHLATAASDRVFAHGGGLLAYGPSILHLYERAGIYAGNVLKGTRPRELPVEEPTRFELIVNRSTATALGVTLPPSVLLRADEVIE